MKFLIGALIFSLFGLVMNQSLLAGNIKVVDGGFGSGGEWVESGNRLPDNWSPLQLGQCYAASTTPAAVQAVGYGGDGTTCSFQNYETNMPQIHQNGYYIAASTDVYQGFHFPDNWRNNPRAPQWGICDYNGGVNFNETNYSRMCGQGCGECYQITGPGGSYTFIVNEVGDIGAGGISAQGINMALGNGAGPAGFGPAPCRGSNGVQDAGECNLKVLSFQGPTAITMKKVPCPVEGNIVLGVFGYSTNSLDGSNTELVVLHHRLGVVSMWIQGRNATGSPSGWKWVPRDWTNRFLFEPGVGLNGFVYDKSTTKTFDIKLRPVSGPDLICQNIVWNPQPTSANPKRGVQSLGNCQFPDPGVNTQACSAAFPPNPVISEQFYAYKGSTPNDCPDLNKVVSGCSIKMEGNFPIEWLDWGSYNLSPFPNYGFKGDCHSGTHCVDTTISTGFAGVQIGWAQTMVVSQYPQITSFHYWAKCKTNTCNNIVFSIYGGQSQSAAKGCSTVSAPPVNLNGNWTEYVVDMAPLLKNCTTYFQTITWTFGPGIQFYLDDAAFFCGSSACVSSSNSNGTVGTTTTAGTTSNASPFSYSLFLLLSIFSLFFVSFS